MRTSTSNSHTKHWNWVYSLGLEWIEAAATAFAISPPTKSSPSNRDITLNDDFEITEAYSKVNESGSDFFSTITHELRTPLTSIRAFSEILKDNPDLDPAQRAQYLDIIVQESDKLSEIVNQTLDLVEVEVESLELNLDNVDLSVVFEDCLESVKSQMQQSNVQIQLRLPDQMPPVYANRDRLTQVILILLSEAIKYADAESGWVGIRVCVTTDTLRVDIFNNGSVLTVDEGSGQTQLPPQTDRPHITMYRTPNLNLIACYDMLARYGGQLTVEQNVPHGLRFTFTLPLCSE